MTERGRDIGNASRSGFRDNSGAAAGDRLLFRRVRGQVLEATNGEHRVPTVASERPHEYQSLVGEHYLGVLPAAEAVADVATAPSAPAPDVAAVDVERLDVAELRLPGRAGRRERADRDRPAVRGRPRFGSELVVRHVRMFGYTEPLAKLSGCDSVVSPACERTVVGATKAWDARIPRFDTARWEHGWVTGACRAPSIAWAGAGRVAYVTRRRSWSAVSASTPNMQWHITLEAPRTRTWRPPNSSLRRPLTRSPAVRSL